MTVELYNSDCLIEMPRLIERGVKVEACIADIPYGTTACAWDSVIPFAPMWQNLKALCEKNAAIVLFGSQPFTSALVMSNPQMFKYSWHWKKERGTGFALSDRRPLNITEDACVFYAEQPIYNPQRQPLAKPYVRKLTQTPSASGNMSNLITRGKVFRAYTHDTPTSLIEFPRENGCHNEHPTQKPIELMRYLVRTYTNEGDTVLDFTMGSGTTGVACVIEKRSFIGIEQDEHYFSVAEARIKRAQGQPCDIPKRAGKEIDTPLFNMLA